MLIGRRDPHRFVYSVSAAVLALVALGPSASAQVECDFVRIAPVGSNPSLDSDGSHVAFESRGNLTGENIDGNSEVFLHDGSSLLQITDSSFFHGSWRPSLDADGNRVAFNSDGNLTGNNPDRNTELFLYDSSSVTQVTDTTTLPPGFTRAPSISGDGSKISFHSFPDVIGDPADWFEIFLFDGTGILQVTDSSSAHSLFPSTDADGSHVAFRSRADLTGGNPDGNDEIFLYDGSAFIQITSSDSPPGSTSPPSLDADGSHVAFASSANFTGENPDGSREIFLYDGATIRQITDSISENSIEPSVDTDASHVAFTSGADFTGQNPDGNAEIFLFDGSGLIQVTDSRFGGNRDPSVDADGVHIAFSSSTDPTGENPDIIGGVFIATCQPTPSVLEVPTLSRPALLLLALLFAGASLVTLRLRN